jgi:NodT family efflux transporter outer membrane factor (OMF) lipoprotein
VIPRRRALIAVAAVAAAGGCAVGPDYERPQLEVSERFSPRPGAAATSAEPESERWWAKFGDPVLEDLVARADMQNIDLRRALLALETFRAQYSIDFSRLFPDINTGLAYSRRRVDANQIGVPNPDALRTGFSNWQWNIASATWELDVWGAVRRQVEAGVSRVQATASQYRAALVSIRAEVATAYMTIRQLQAQRAAVRDLATGYERLLEAIEAKVERQVGSRRELAEVRSRRSSAIGDAYRFDGEIARQIAGISILLAETPERVRALVEPVRPIPLVEETVAVGVPAALLERRPDVKAAERLLQAATAEIGVAEAGYLPRFSFTGEFVIQTPDFANLTDISQNMTYGLTPAVVWNFMNILTGRTQAQVTQAKARAADALLRYQLAAITAINQVESSIAAYTAARSARANFADAAREIDDAYQLAFLQYNRGRVNLESLILFLQAAVVARDGLAQASGLTAQNYVELYRSLGGGWEGTPMPPAVDDVDRQFRPDPKANDFLAPPTKPTASAG